MARSKCNKDLYRSFLQASSVRYTGNALLEMSPVQLSHDSVSRWLNSNNFRPSQVWQEVSKYISNSSPCLLIADDTILNKEYSKKIALVNYQYSGTKHDVIPGIGLVNLVHHNLSSNESIPIDYRVYDKDTDGKTKNTHFCEMISLAKKRGVTPEAVVMDTWYSSLQNLKSIRDHGWIWVAPLRKNRKVNRNISLESLDFPDEGLQVHLRGYGWIMVYKFVAKNGRIDYVATNMQNPSRDKIENIVKARWSIEVYHRELKQTCGIERCQARTGRAQRNHICMSVIAWIEMHKIRIKDSISLYQQTWDAVKDSISYNIKLLLSMNQLC